MSALAGFVGPGDPQLVERMLARVAYRGDRQELAGEPGFALGYRHWSGSAGESSAIARDAATLTACAGTLAPMQTSPAERLRASLCSPAPALDELDGTFAFAHWNTATRTLTLGRDPFGARAIYYVQLGETFYFATELKQLLAIDALPAVLDPSVIHKYLTFSCVPGEAMPIAGVRRLPPGQLLGVQQGRLSFARYFELVERIDERFNQTDVAARLVARVASRATRRRIGSERDVALYLSGGLDSAAVAVWLKHAGANVHAFSLDFGVHAVERDEAREAARAVGITQHWVAVDGAAIATAFDEVVDKLDLPFGDPVTVPQYLLGQAAHAAGLRAAWNGEGGDQLFGGWTNKPMIAAELYAGLYELEADSREEMYLRSYHRFYGSEHELYTPEFAARVGPPGQRRALVREQLGGDESFLARVRQSDIWLKGSDNIAPRAEAMAGAWGLQLAMPLFDRKLATAAFRLPPQLKLHGACEKYVLKLAMQKQLPAELVWRRKSGMSVPITDYVLSPPLSGLLDTLLSPSALAARGLFRPEFVAQLRAGRDLPHEPRRRRVGERLWALLMLEAWLRRYVDQRGGSR